MASHNDDSACARNEEWHVDNSFTDKLKKQISQKHLVAQLFYLIKYEGGSNKNVW